MKVWPGGASRRSLVIFGAAVLFALVTWLPLLLADGSTTSAEHDLSAGLWRVIANSLRYSREMPTWQPNECGGILLWQEGATRAYSPFNFLIAQFGDHVAYGAWLLFTSSLAAWGMGLFASRILRLTRTASAFAAIAWCLAGSFIAPTVVGTTIYAGVSLLPLALYLWRRSVRHLHYAIFFAMLIGWISLDTGVGTACVLLIAVLMDALLAAISSTQRARIALVLCANFFLALLVSAFRFVPVFTGHFAKRELPGSREALSLREFLTLFTDRAWTNGLFVHHPHPWAEYTAYVGWPLLLLACVGLIGSARHRVSRVAIFGFLAALMMLGDHGRLSPWRAIVAIPHIAKFMSPADMRALVVFALVLLAARAIDLISQTRTFRLSSEQGARWLFLIPAFVCLGPIADLCLKWNDTVTLAISPAPGNPNMHNGINDPTSHEMQCWTGPKGMNAAGKWPVDVAQTSLVTEKHKVPAEAMAQRNNAIDRSGRTGAAVWAEIELEVPSTVVFNQAYTRDWHGQKGELRVVDGKVGLHADRGVSRVAAVYRAPHLVLSTWLSLSGLFLLIVAALVSSRAHHGAKMRAPQTPQRTPKATKTLAHANGISAALAFRDFAHPRVWMSSAVVDHVLAGSFAAVGLALVDVVVMLVRPQGQNVSATSFLLASAHLFALYVPVGIVVGAALGFAINVTRTAPPFRAIRDRMVESDAWVRIHPEVLATCFAIAVTLGFVGLIVFRAAVQFEGTMHRSALAALSTTAVALCAMVIGVFVYAGARTVSLPVFRLIPRTASVRGVLAITFIAATTIVAIFLSKQPVTWTAFDPFRVVWPPVYFVLHIAGWALVRRYARDLGADTGRLRALSFCVAAVALLAVAISGATFGMRSTVRDAVEDRSVLGRQLIRGYARLTDRDRDGYSFAFGGSDCNDHNAKIHPGAEDIPGDGIDSDCFDGDGSRDIALLGNGAYGTLAPRLRKPNIVIFTIDALRPDHLGAYGYSRATSPNIDVLAAQSVVFEQALAQSTRTIRSIPSFFTGQYPSQILYGDEYLQPSIKPENVTLAEVLRDHGYRTGAVLGTNYFRNLDGFCQGFDEVSQAGHHKPEREYTVEQGIQMAHRLKDTGKPWMMWMHTMSVHEEYLYDKIPSRFGPDRAGAYDTEISLMDAIFKRFLDELSQMGVANDTIIVIASDHGEGFGEHGVYGHGTTLYNEELRATLIIHAPGVAARHVTSAVALFDIMPTVLNFAGIPLPAKSPARSLVPLMLRDSAADAKRLIFSELIPDGFFPFDQKSLREGTHSLIWSVRDGWMRLFDVSRDPGETDNIADDEPRVFREMSGLLHAWVANNVRPEMRSEDVAAANRLSAEPDHMDHRLDASIPGEFTILGFDLPQREYRRGERIPMTFYYRADSNISNDYFFKIGFTGPPGSRVPSDFHGSHHPVNGRYNTNQWKAGDIIRDSILIWVPDTVRVPVEVTIHLSVSSGPDNFQLVQSGETHDYIDIGKLQIR